RQVDVSGTAPARGVRDRRELIAQYLARVVQKAPDQRALAVVHTTCRDEAHHAAGAPDRPLRLAFEFSEQSHQKYPSLLRRSIEASEVRSSIRVAPRSLTVVETVSTTISSALAAADSTGQ